MPYFNKMNITATDVETQNRKKAESSDCLPLERAIKNVSLAQAYVPYQFLCDVYDCQTALDKGTAFPELYKPMRTQYR
jgi:hypothetical protein